MGYLPQVEMAESFLPFVLFREKLGFVPNLFRAQTLLPRVIEVEARLAAEVLLKEGALSRLQKESILLVIAARHRNVYCVTAHGNMLRSLGVDPARLAALTSDYHGAGLPPADGALLDFAAKLSIHPTWVGMEDVEAARRHGLSDSHLLEAIVVTGLTEFLCTLSTGLGVPPDFEPERFGPDAGGWSDAPVAPSHAQPGPFLQAPAIDARTFPPFVLFRDRFGFVPNIFRAQTLRPDILEAEAQAVRDILLTEDVLSRAQKEYILLAVSAANLNTYCVAVHCEMLRNLGVPDDLSDQIAFNHNEAGLQEADEALLDFAVKLSTRPLEFSLRDIETLQAHGFGNEQVLEAIVMTAMTRFLNTIQMGLGPVSDFPPRRVFPPEPNPERSVPHPIGEAPFSALAGGPSGDPDCGIVAQVKAGDVEAFEELVIRHHHRIYRVLVGVIGSADEAEDGTQTVFLKAFQHIGTFHGGSRFSTWLTRIAINEGLQRLRGVRGTTSFTEATPEEAEEFRPRQLQSWAEDPETQYSRGEIRALVEKGLMELPAKYRVAVMLRDLEQFSTEEAAAALGLGIPTLKTRLLRGRLLLREALAPHFRHRSRGQAHV